MADRGVSSRTSLLICGVERDQQRQLPEVGRRPNKSSGEFVSTVSTTRASHATVSKYEGTTKFRLVSSSLESFHSGASSHQAAKVYKDARPHWLSGASSQPNSQLDFSMLCHARTTYCYLDNVRRWPKVKNNGQSSAHLHRIVIVDACCWGSRSKLSSFRASCTKGPTDPKRSSAARNIAGIQLSIF
jgi:hypothetical protein